VQNPQRTGLISITTDFCSTVPHLPPSCCLTLGAGRQGLTCPDDTVSSVGFNKKSISPSAISEWREVKGVGNMRVHWGCFLQFRELSVYLSSPRHDKNSGTVLNYSITSYVLEYTPQERKMYIRNLSFSFQYRHNLTMPGTHPVLIGPLCHSSGPASECRDNGLLPIF
jgi:hypothetical protein